MNPSTEYYAETFLKLERDQAGELLSVQYSDPPVAHIYNPISYASVSHEMYVRKYLTGPKSVVFLGLNPGPFGMVQTGVPFGEISAVRDWLGINASVEKPLNGEHPLRPISGFGCKRSEVSGRRLWNLLKLLSEGKPDKFFRHGFVHNYCSLAFMNGKGNNITPPALKRADLLALQSVCDRYTAQFLVDFQVKTVVAIGKFVNDRVLKLLSEGKWGISDDVVVMSILHPSPANPATNKQPGWETVAAKQLRDGGVLEKLCLS